MGDYNFTGGIICLVGMAPIIVAHEFCLAETTEEVLTQTFAKVRRPEDFEFYIKEVTSLLQAKSIGDSH